MQLSLVVRRVANGKLPWNFLFKQKIWICSRHMARIQFVLVCIECAAIPSPQGNVECTFSYCSKFRPKNRLFYWKGGCWIIQARCWVHRSELSSKERDHLQHLDQCLWEGWAVAKGIVSRQDILVQVCTQKQIEYTVIVFTAVRLEASFSFSSWSDVCCLTAWRASFIDILVRLFLKQMEHQQVRSNWLALGRASRAILEANIVLPNIFQLANCKMRQLY